METNNPIVFTAMNLENIRKSSLSKVEALGYPVNQMLPPPDSHVSTRSVSAVIDRMLVLHCIAAAAFGFDRKKALHWLQREAPIAHLTEDERDFLEFGKGDRQKHADQVESIFALSWSVGLVPVLEFSIPCPDDFVELMPNLNVDEDAGEIRRKARLRSLSEIMASLDFAYCLHWALRDVEISKRRVRCPIDPYIVVERRRALEWLVTDVDWDEITLDT